MRKTVRKILRVVVWMIIVLWVIMTAAGYIISYAPFWNQVTQPPAISEGAVMASLLPPARGEAISLDTLVAQVLSNIHLHGWNPEAMTHGVRTGGLFINWNMADPSRVNVVRPGPSGATLSSHDPQVDLLYLTVLSEHQRLHPLDPMYRSDLRRMLRLVRDDFRTYSLPRGWIYFDLLADGQALQDDELREEAHSLAERFYRIWYNPLVGTVYDHEHTPPDYSTVHSLECGDALIDAGRRWNQPDWVDAGERTLNHLVAATWSPRYHLFYEAMWLAGNQQDQPSSSQVRAATEGEAVNALGLAYQLTGQRRYLQVAGEILQSLFSTSGLWDQARGGFYFALRIDTGSVITDYKETRAQCLTLEGLHRYNHLALSPLLAGERDLEALLLGPFYQRTYHGFFYRLRPDFKVYVSRPGAGIGVEDYFTTEAMGCALDALQQTRLPLMPLLQP
jgi:hypothetical protein